MLRRNLPTVLILESDAAWDVNIRPIMVRLSEEFGAFLRTSGSQPLYRDSTKNDNNKNKNNNDNHNRGGSRTSKQAQSPTKRDLADGNGDDPWHSSHWDVFAFGPCYDELKLPSTYHQYHDPFGPLSAALSLSTSSQPNDTEGSARDRIIYRSGGPVCTTAYAITKRGAAKLLARTAMNLNAPLDMIIRHMVQRDELAAYGTIPTVMAQWDYVGRIGMESRGPNGAGSDIFRGPGQNNHDRQGGKENKIGHNKPKETIEIKEEEGEKKKKQEEEDDEMDGWEDVMETKTVWTLKPNQPHALFEEMALQKAWAKIFSTDKNIEVQ